MCARKSDGDDGQVLRPCSFLGVWTKDRAMGVNPLNTESNVGRARIRPEVKKRSIVGVSYSDEWQMPGEALFDPSDSCHD